jgi:hypothetical protein
MVIRFISGTTLPPSDSSLMRQFHGWPRLEIKETLCQGGGKVEITTEDLYARREVGRTTWSGQFCKWWARTLSQKNMCQHSAAVHSIS